MALPRDFGRLEQRLPERAALILRGLRQAMLGGGFRLAPLRGESLRGFLRACLREPIHGHGHASAERLRAPGDHGPWARPAVTGRGRAR